MRCLHVPATNKLLMIGIFAAFIGSIQPATILADYYEYDCRATIDEFLDIVKTGNKAVLSRVIIFPLERPYPIPSITRDEFLERYHEVFDEEFVRTIIESDQFD